MFSNTFGAISRQSLFLLPHPGRFRGSAVALALFGVVCAPVVWIPDASGAVIDIVGPTKLATAGNNNAKTSDALGDSSISGTPWFVGDSSGVKINFSGSYQVTWIYLGAESGFTNTFLTGGFTADENGTPPTGQYPLDYVSSLPGSTFPNPSVVTYSGTAGDFIPFAFKSPTGPTTRANGDATNDPVGPSEDPVTTIYSYVVPFDIADMIGLGGSIAKVILTDGPSNFFIAGFDDSGAGPDDNHDDYMVIGYVQPIPLPAALPLFGAALAGIGLIGWRRKRTTQAA